MVLKKKLGLPEKTRVILYVGRFSPDKDTGLLLRAWEKMEEIQPEGWTGVMVGDGQMKGDVEKFIRKHPRIRHVPYLQTQRELAEWYQAADLLIHPGRWETFGLVLLEAQACGLPVIGIGHREEARRIWRMRQFYGLVP